MRRFSLQSSFNSLEMLELKLSPTALAVGALVTAPVLSSLHAGQSADDGDDPLSPQELDPPPDPGGDPPIGYPILPPSGPIGPG